MNAGTSAENLEVTLGGILLDDAWHREVLEALREVAPFAWITGGFVRSAIWDAVFAKEEPGALADVDVIYLDTPEHALLTESGLGRVLSRHAPGILWSVRDQGRMHARNGDHPYRTLDEALRGFPDKSSAVGVRLLADGGLEILAPFGLEDAFRGVVRPTPAGLSDGRFQHFLKKKLPGWRERWPWLLVASAPVPGEDTGRRAA
jgi:hypothetical protein